MDSEQGTEWTTLGDGTTVGSLFAAIVDYGEKNNLPPTGIGIDMDKINMKTSLVFTGEALQSSDIKRIGVALRRVCIKNNL